MCIYRSLKYNILNDDILDKTYPIGSIYISTISTSPNTLFGGIWEQITDKFLLSSGNTYKAGNTGGEATHKLTIAEMPKHTHTQNAHAHVELVEPWGNGLQNLIRGTGTSTAGARPMGESFYNGNKGDATLTSSATATNNITGSDTAHNNMPPYLTVYMWKRVS